MDWPLTKLKRQELLQELKLERYSRYSDRIKTILLLDDGENFSDIAKFLFLTEGSIRNYHKSYTEGGLEQLISDGYKGSDSKMSQADMAKLKMHLSDHLYRNTKGILSYVKQEFNVTYSVSGMTHLLQRMGFSYKKPKGVPKKAKKKEQATFLNRYRQIKCHGPVYFADSTHPMFNAVLGYGWIQKGQDFEVKTTSNRMRLNINGAIEINSLDVITRSCEKVNQDSISEMLRAIKRKNPKEEKIYLVLDNARYHHAKKVKRLAKSLKIRLVYLPPYSPNLNPIERLWKFMKKRAIGQCDFDDFDDFKKHVMEFFRNIRKYKSELRSLLTDNFEILGS